MPTYAYQCSACEHVEEKRMKIAERNDPIKEPCPECGCTEERKMLLGAPRVVSGVSVTDKRPDGWRDVLKKVHGASGRTSTINT